MNADPIIHCTLDGHRTEMHRRNSGLYLFAGKLASFDHAWVYNEEFEIAGYVWKDIPEHRYMRYAKFMIDNAFPIHKNLQEVQDVDMRSYEMAHTVIVSENVIQFPKAFEGLLGHE